MQYLLIGFDLLPQDFIRFFMEIVAYEKELLLGGNDQPSPVELVLASEAFEAALGEAEEVNFEGYFDLKSDLGRDGFSFIGDAGLAL